MQLSPSERTRYVTRLPDRYRVGEVNGGWKLITGQLNIERLTAAAIERAARARYATI